MTGTDALLTWDETPGATGYIVTLRRRGATDRKSQETFFNFVYLENLRPLTTYEVNVVLAQNKAETGKFYSFTTLEGILYTYEFTKEAFESILKLFK